MNARVVAVALALGLATASSVQAHTQLEKAEPAAASTVTTAPKELRLHFSAAVLARFTNVKITGPAGETMPAGPVAVDPQDKALVVVPLQGALPAGVYQVDWNTAASDMHKMSGSYRFTVQP